MARTVGSAADETRQRILDVAVDLFIEKGYAGTSVRDISERLGMTKGSLYYHFASKEDVLTALVAPLLDDLDSFVAAPCADERTNVEHLVNLLDSHGVMLRSLMGDPSVLRGMTAKRSLPERISAIQQALGGGTTPSAIMRGRLTLGVINAGALAPRWDAMAANDRSILIRTRLSEDDKRTVVSAALAVLATVPVS